MASESHNRDDWFHKSDLEEYCDDTDIDILDQRYLEYGLDLDEKFSTPLNGIDENKIIYSFSSKTTDTNIVKLCKSEPERYKRCTLDIVGVREAVCTPLDEDHYPAEKIYISGRSKCGQAFNEDIVVVEIIQNCYGNSQSDWPKRVEGRVVAIVERTRYNDIEHPVFVCTAADMERRIMFPSCKTVPKIYISNRRVMKERKQEEQYLIETYRYNELEGYLMFDKFFKIKPEKIESLIFLVAFLRWDVVCQYPLGAVIGVVDVNSSNILRITELRHRIPSRYKPETMRAVHDIIKEESRKQESSDVDDTLVFTIDSKNTRVRDDGFSVEGIPNAADTETETAYRVGVHLADVCRLVQKDDPVDREAMERCRTNYAGMGAKPCHMLPEPLSTNMLSLIQGKTRHVFSLYFEINKDGKVLKYPEPQSIKRRVIKTRTNLCYEEVQNVLLGDKDIYVPGLSTKLKIMYDLATKLRNNRLKRAHFAFPGNALLGLEEDKDNAIHEAHYLVEEFMILTNVAVANILEDVYPNNIPLRTHAYPDAQQTSAWLGEHNGIADIIMDLQDRDLPDEPHIIGLQNGIRKEKITIDRRIWNELRKAYAAKDHRRLKILLRTDDHHPMQSVALQKWKLFQRKAKYSRSLNGTDKLHFGLRVDLFTHATSPIRRYTDLVIQRLLLASIENETYPPYTALEIDDICDRSNEGIHREERFYQKYRTHVLAAHLKNSNAAKVSAIVVGLLDQTTVELIILGYKFTEEPFHLRFNLLGLCSQPELQPLDGKTRQVIAKWKKPIYDTCRIAFHLRKEIQKNCFTIDPNGNSVFVSYTDWVSLLQASIDDTSSESEQLFIRQTEPQPESIRGNADDNRFYAPDVCSEVKKHEYILKHLCSFERIFEVGQTLKVQISGQQMDGCLVPTIQLVYVTETIAFCLQHVADPIPCLSRYTTTPTKKTYKDDGDYLRIWIPILEMEEVTNIIRNEDSPLVKNVPVTFDTKLTGTFTLNARFCKERNIDLGFKKKSKEDNIADEDDAEDDFDDDDEHDVPFHPVVCCDFLCIRLPCEDKNVSNQTYDWVGHARTTKTRRLGAKTRARYEIGFDLHNCPDIPDKGKYLCTLELLTKSSVHRRAEETIKGLRDATQLAKAIALGRKIPELERYHLHAVESLPRDINEPNVDIPKNNAMQQEAIDAALRLSFSLIQGPPGTGKTFTGLKLIYLFHQLNKMAEGVGRERRQILFCGPSNKSVDLVARWMKERFMNCPKAPRLVRFYSQIYECVDFPVPGRIESARRSLRNAKPDPYLTRNHVVVHYLIRREGKTYADEIHQFDEKFQGRKYDVTFDDVQSYFKIVSEATKEVLQNCDVIFCTTAMAANPKLLKATKGKIYQCIIDESGMCTEPETMVPIIATRAAQVVLIGDHKQLQPILQSRAAKELGLVNSLFEKYAGRTTTHLTMLKQQYRMNPWICSFPSKEFYGDKLTTDQKYTAGWLVNRPLKIWKNNNPKNHIPIAFVHVEGKEVTLEVSTEEGNEKSKSNLEEAKQAVEIFEHLVKREKLNVADIRILSQYNAQRQLIHRKITEIKTEEKIAYPDVRVDTVVASQGGESDYVILSTVRSMPRPLIEHRPALGWKLRHLGFITDRHQINVALTRAKKGLFIIGNKHLLRCDKTWENLLNFYENNERVFNDFPL
ncbi:helicase with zinc finger domain 2-like [Mizuhopecten yessoensis]|uniref:helicase with zinc finger domain 2-like n=1 Tax=Mizuhopecten yessoensis TaxID=6573 RepID=UPI000B45D2BA|nr:helicase with zinc finger domain 2-like [Mizuhopecten yessoensis]XP_021378074.1 helicase with zinc finger domain 2-like [Mizuhopecten yessoensis]XP_021378075.1 helicase with zinc finger domain 2-like [Mizuhopecten yessoensis]